MNDKNLLDLPEYPCTRCEHKTDRCISEPKHCPTWSAWNKALTEVGVAAAQAIYATSDRDALHDHEERDYAAEMRRCPCLECASQICGYDPDGKGSCYAWCMWKVKDDETQRRRDQCLQLALQLLRARAGDYYKTWNEHRRKDVERGPLDCYTAYTIYDTCASILAEAMDLNYEVLQQFICGMELPAVPTRPCDYCEESRSCGGMKPGGPSTCMRWVDWNTNIRLDSMS